MQDVFRSIGLIQNKNKKIGKIVMMTIIVKHFTSAMLFPFYDFHFPPPKTRILIIFKKGIMIK